MTMAEYVLKRNGVPLGESNSLRNMLLRSLGAKNFAEFWNYWNPIFGYFLGYKIFKPIKTILPDSMAFLTTFLVSGLIHDLAALIFTGRTSFLFSIWFLWMATGVLLTQLLKFNFSKKPFVIRALINLTIILFCLAIAFSLKKFLGFEILLSQFL
ncbi:MBOAT family O-acyltransferase [Algoriphagus sp. CAU 1675]|uniref:MBOAT family O-acyltransferase n=1 Tax=Algoriphagus sp. CAU 1675 TaxID=3032597 RepID=UPI0023DA960E|nr:MBOAT family O-acyltransferase [Algoriphagus sp. CAU 1675]MDF2157120.1 acyltransferase [Algoriphagus sp. CAU 1675]